MKKKMIIIVGVIGLLLIVCGIVFYVVNSAQNTPNNTSDNDNTTNTSTDTGNNTNTNTNTGNDTGNAEEVKEDMSTSVNPDADYYKEEKNGTLKNTSEKIAKKHKNGDLTVEDMSITFNEEDVYLAKYSYKITNNGSKDYNNLKVSIVFIFSDGTRLNSTASTIESLKAGKSTKLNRKDYVSIVGAVDYKIVIGDAI